MTDLSKKEKIISIICYIAYSAVLTYQRRYWFSLVYFAVIAIVIFFANKIIESDSINKKTLCAFFITAIGYQTMFEIFFSAHITSEQILSAVAAGIFFACIFALTDTKKHLFGVIAAPVLCFLNVKIAVCYSVFLLCFSIVNLQLCKQEPQKKKSSKKDKSKRIISPEKLDILSIAISIVCFGVCVYLMLSLDGYIKENLNYLLVRFKNPLALTVTAIYLAARIFKSKFKAKFGIIISLVIFIAATVFSTFILGWSVFALFCFCISLFLGLLCLKESKTVEAIKTDYSKNKFLFWAITVCLLQ